MNRRRCAASCAALTLAAFASTSIARTQPVPDYSGTWIAGRVDIVDRRDRESGGWDNMLAGLGQRRGSQLTIRQTPGEVTLIFPGSSFLNVAPYRLDANERTYTQDAGAYWRKTITTAAWQGTTLMLGSRTLVGWWKDARPEEVQRQDTETRTSQALTLERDGAGLSVTTTVADEKGTATYRTLFSRAAQ